ncbi:MAG: YkvA family protein [Candidatus Binatia bacterium]
MGSCLRGSMGVAPALATGWAAPVFERRLSLGTTNLFKTVRRRVRRLVKTIRWSATKWVDWVTAALGFSLVGLLAPLLDRALLTTWRERGFQAFWASMTLAAAVYVRLLADRRAPMVGKALLAFAVVYGVARHDLLPDYVVPEGFVDDLVLIILASRCFLRLCPDWLVEEHALEAARKRDEWLAHRGSRGAPPGDIERTPERDLND